MVRQLFVYCLIAGERCRRMCLRIAPGWDHKEFKVDFGSTMSAFHRKITAENCFSTIFVYTIQHNTRITVRPCTLAASIKSERNSRPSFEQMTLDFLYYPRYRVPADNVPFTCTEQNSVRMYVCCWMAAWGYRRFWAFQEPPKLLAHGKRFSSSQNAAINAMIVCARMSPKTYWSGLWVYVTECAIHRLESNHHNDDPHTVIHNLQNTANGKLQRSCGWIKTSLESAAKLGQKHARSTNTGIKHKCD